MNIQCVSYHIMIMVVVIITICIVSIISVVLYSGFVNVCAVFSLFIAATVTFCICSMRSVALACTLVVDEFAV